MNQQDAARHIEQLAKQLGAKLFFDVDIYGAVAETVSRTVHLSPWGASDDWRDQYWPALHELGHVATEPHKRTDFFEQFVGIPPEKIAEFEAEAWDWAFQHGNPEADIEVGKNLARLALGGYVDRAPKHFLENPSPVLGRVAREIASAPRLRKYETTALPPRWRNATNRLIQNVNELANAA